MAAFMKPFGDQTYAAFRIVAGLLCMSHGLSKLVGWPTPAPPPDMMPDAMRIAVGLYEGLGGAAIAAGFMTRWAAFLCSGLMAGAYWTAHGLNAFHPLANQGELAVLYCFAFLFIAARGAGIWSVDGSRGAS